MCIYKYSTFISPFCSCQSAPGFRNESNIADDCINNKCKNNVICIDFIQGYECKGSSGCKSKFL